MIESESESPSNPNPSSQQRVTIPFEFVSEEEMALIEAAYARSSICSPSRFESNTRSLHSITLLSKRRLSGPIQLDIEDFENLKNTQKRKRVAHTYFHRFRRTTGLSVTDLTSTEWCEKHMEFSLLFAKPKITIAMKAGLARHAKLEQEVFKKEKVRDQSVEDIWALKFIKFISGANQLLFEGLTRELPLIGFVGGVCLVGVINEIRMPKIEGERKPILVDTKTRVRDSLPAEPQRRNGSDLQEIMGHLSC